MDPEFRLVDTASELKVLGKVLAREAILAIDTEADSFHHYFPKVCLIQISTPQHTFLIDPLALQTVDALRPLFANYRTIKILHGADYDLRSLFRDFAITINNLFDTMVASQFIGEKEPSLAVVVKKRFGIRLNKKYQRANWSKRPLDHDMLVYAAHDTAHLIRLYHELVPELASKGRLSWVEEESRCLSLKCTMGLKAPLPCRSANEQGSSASFNDPTAKTPMFKRFKGAGKMARRDLAILERLLVYREKRAMAQDRPPFKVFENRVIKELVNAKPTTRSDLEEIPSLPSGFMKRYAKGVLGAINRGLELPAHRLPTYPKSPRPAHDPEKQAHLKRLKRWRTLKARELEIQPGLVCNNALLHTLAETNPKSVNALKSLPGMKVWQRETFGQEIVEVIRGN